VRKALTVASKARVRDEEKRYTEDYQRSGVVMNAVARAIAIALVILMTCSATAKAADDRSWGWFAALSAINSWWITSGKARVVVSGTSFSAELFDGRDGEKSVTLTGTINADRVEAIAARHSTEDQPRRLTGTRTRLGPIGQRPGRESILLTEPRAAGGLTVGLTREVE